MGDEGGGGGGRGDKLTKYMHIKLKQLEHRPMCGLSNFIERESPCPCHCSECIQIQAQLPLASPC